MTVFLKPSVSFNHRESLSMLRMHALVKGKAAVGWGGGARDTDTLTTVRELGKKKYYLG